MVNNMTISANNRYRNSNNTFTKYDPLYEIIDLSIYLDDPKIPLKQKGVIAKKQRKLMIKYTNQLSHNHKKNFEVSTRWYYSASNLNEMYANRKSEVSDRKLYRAKILKKVRDFRLDLNVIYIGISQKIHNYFRRFRSFMINFKQKMISTYNFVVRDYLYDLRVNKIPNYLEYMHEVKRLYCLNKRVIKNLNKSVLK